MTTQRASTSLPPKLQQAATAGQLGSLLRSYNASGVVFIHLGLGIILLIPAIVLVTLWLTAISSPIDRPPTGDLFFTTLFLLVFLASSLFLAYWGLRGAGQKVYLFQHGIIVIRWGRLSVYPWTQIQAIRQRITRIYRMSTFGQDKYAGTRYGYSIQGVDDKMLRLDGSVQNIQELGETITLRFSEVFFPTALASLTAGALVPFGPWSITRQGITGKKGVLPWSEVHSYFITTGRISILTKKGFWDSKSLRRIPNVFVFMALVDMLKVQNRG